MGAALGRHVSPLAPRPGRGKGRGRLWVGIHHPFAIASSASEQTPSQPRVAAGQSSSLHITAPNPGLLNLADLTISSTPQREDVIGEAPRTL